MKNPIINIGEEEALSLGFAFLNEYTHDQYHTRMFKKEELIVEFTYEGQRLDSCSLDIDEIEAIQVNDISQLQALVGALEALKNGSITQKSFWALHFDYVDWSWDTRNMKQPWWWISNILTAALWGIILEYFFYMF